ncbi:MAG: nuclear transport factor 2 family protein [Mycobacterium sp.]|nr:nuclear transport factor 2 family protein [Mycobacterium sp.]
MTEPPGAPEQITALIHRYATAIDTKDWELFATCSTTDAVSDYGDIGRWNSARKITEFMTAAHAGMRDTKHMLHNVVVTMAGPSRATAVSYVHTVQALAVDPDGWIDAVGQYNDELVDTADGWRIGKRVFTMTRMLTSYQLRQAH